MDTIDYQRDINEFETAFYASPEAMALFKARDLNNQLSFEQENRILLVIETIDHIRQGILECTQKFQADVEKMGITEGSVGKVEQRSREEILRLLVFTVLVKEQNQKLYKYAKQTPLEQTGIESMNNCLAAANELTSIIQKALDKTAQIRRSS